MDGFSRVHGSAHAAVVDLTPEQLAWRADPEANSIAWLLWHLARVQDDHVAGVAGVPQVWTAQGWNGRFALPFDDADLDRVVDAGWDPPVTLGVRLVSVLNDDLQHVGQAALLRGMVERRG